MVKNKDKKRKTRPPKSGNKPLKPRRDQVTVKLPKPQGDEVVLFGMHAVREAWHNPSRDIKALYVTKQTAARAAGFLQTPVKHPELKRPEPTIVAKDAIDGLTGPVAVHQGIACIAGDLPPVSIQDWAAAAQNPQDGHEGGVYLLLDQVTDPHNVGAILRSASAFGARGVIMQTRHAPALEGVLAKTACGAAEHVDVAYETNLNRAIDTLKNAGFLTIGLDERGHKTIGAYAHTLQNDTRPVVLLLGAEGKGLRRLLKENCDVLVRLPTQGAIQSLNVSNAAAVALYVLLSR